MYFISGSISQNQRPREPLPAAMSSLKIETNADEKLKRFWAVPIKAAVTTSKPMEQPRTCITRNLQDQWPR